MPDTFGETFVQRDVACLKNLFCQFTNPFCSCHFLVSPVVVGLYIPSQQVSASVTVTMCQIHLLLHELQIEPSFRANLTVLMQRV